ncbi:chemotaxis protein CheD [Yoonia vestfoldensis]|uniref:chemotaxis protein CheD n=1 Tax=Yoonia vestfoldensis TaxID=245188 RepID=UPI00035C7CB1|nr:chemotaxis protein CheD [Yoonia vestfoldensis]
MVTIVQGDFAVSNDVHVVMSTILGSCVAVCLFDRQAKVGGMNHFLLATGGDANTADLKYGVNAMELLINKILRAGGDRRRLQAKIFGGARMTVHARDIGQSNGDFAQSFLEREGIPCLSQSLGGTLARRVQFTPTTGAARQMQITGSPPPETQVTRPRQAADITLF